MNSIVQAPTPMHFLQNLSSKLGVNLAIKRDDLFGMVGGGNKARKIQYILKYAKEKGFNAFVTNGGIQSNHARAAALAASLNNMKCYLVLHTEHPDEKNKLSGNLLLMYQTGAHIIFCNKTDLAVRMDSTMELARNDGFNPLYIWGGGHCLEGGLAYYHAAMEAQKQTKKWIPDYIVVPSGTGTTQAGLVAGYAHLNTKIIGISVARKKEQGEKVIKQSLVELCDHLEFHCSISNIDFRDNWIFGGYEKYTSDLIGCINSYAKFGIILDPTYTGKAFYGMLQLIKNKYISPDSNVLFWHTGGFLNLLSCRYYTEEEI